MRVLFTSRFVETVKPPATGRADYLDQQVTGLSLRVTARGVKTWSLAYRDKATGTARRVTFGRFPDVDLKNARLRATSARGRLADGESPMPSPPPTGPLRPPPPPGGLAPAARPDRPATRAQAATAPVLADPDRFDGTWRALGRLYIKRYAKVRKRSWQADEDMIERELSHWRTRQVSLTTKRDVITLLEAIVDRPAPVSANRCLALIRKMLNFAIDQDLLTTNVAARLPKPGGSDEERSRSRVLTAEELKAVWVAADTERLASAVLLRLQMVTAQRAGELSQLKWTDLDGSWVTTPAAVSKTKRDHRWYLTATALALVAQLPRDSQWLFPGRGSALDARPLSDTKHASRRVRLAVCAAKEWASFDFVGRDLRRTASTLMAEAGVPENDIDRVLSHRQPGAPKVRKVYNRYSYDREKRAALEVLEARLVSILGDAIASAA